MATNGKGDKRRPGDSEAYRSGWERIFGPDEIEERPKPLRRPCIHDEGYFLCRGCEDCDFGRIEMD